MVHGFHFIYKRLRAFHYQRGFYAVFIVIFHAQRVLHHFQHRVLLAGNFFQPRIMAGRINNAGFVYIPHFF